MYCACTPTLMGVAILVSEILLISKNGQIFPFRPWTIVHGHSKKFNHLESIQKNHASRGQCIEHAHTTLMGVAIPVSEILLLSKKVKFPFPTMDYSPWSSKNLIIWNQLKKNHASRGQCIVHAHQL